VILSAVQQHGSAPLRAPFMTPAAHPTPAFTDIAWVGQFFAQAPHSMHASRSVISDLLFFIEKTGCGHTVAQSPHPMHLSVLSSSVTTFSRYRKASILNPL
jgi:hypothetical protein